MVRAAVNNGAEIMVIFPGKVKNCFRSTLRLAVVAVVFALVLASYHRFGRGAEGSSVSERHHRGRTFHHSSR